MPAKIEKVVGGKIVDVTRDPKYRRYHVQYLAAMEANANEDTSKGSGFLAGWVAQKSLLGERADAIARARKSFEKGDYAGLRAMHEQSLPARQMPGEAEEARALRRGADQVSRRERLQ